MKLPAERQPIRELVAVVHRLAALNDDICRVVREKVRSMRSADLQEVRNCTTQEQGLLAEISERDGLRRQIQEQVGRALGISASRSRAASLRHLAERLTEPSRSELLSASERLRCALAGLARANQLAGQVSRKVLNHQGYVLCSASGEDDPLADYGRMGRMMTPSSERLFEAVG